MTPENFVAWLSGYYLLNDDLTDKEESIFEYMEDMEVLDFCYFLHGHFELTNVKLTKTEEIIKEHLQLVFDKVTSNTIQSKDANKDTETAKINRRPFDLADFYDNNPQINKPFEYSKSDNIFKNLLNPTITC